MNRLFNAALWVLRPAVSAIELASDVAFEVSFLLDATAALISGDTEA